MNERVLQGRPGWFWFFFNDPSLRGLMVTCRHITGIAPAFALALIILLGSCTTPGGAADQESRQGVLPDEDVTLDEDDPEPLLTITAIILELHWTTPRTQLILDHSPLLKRVFAGDPQVVSFADRDPRRSTRLVFRFHVNTTAAPPFVSDPDRFINPQLYE